MRYGIFTFGSRGDIQPFIALALGLIDRGHQVTMVAPSNFKDLVTGYGISFHAMSVNSEEIVNSVEFRNIVKSGNNFDFFLYSSRQSYKIIPSLQKSLLEVCPDLDVMIFSHLMSIMLTAAEKFNLKWASVHVNPPGIIEILDTSKDSSFNWGWLKRIKYKMASAAIGKLIMLDTKHFRKSLGLSSLKKTNVLPAVFYKNPLFLDCYSEQLVTDSLFQSVHKGNVVTGFFFLPENRRSEYIHEELSIWLQKGEKPIYIGFGSMPIPTPKVIIDIINEVLTKTELRIVFCQGWSDIMDFPVNPNLFIVKNIDFEWLLPRCKMAVIHGGIGTLAHVLKNGIPVIIISLIADQPFWGNIITEKKLGIHIAWPELTSKAFLNALNELDNMEILVCVSQVSEKIRNENGVRIAIDLMEHFFESMCQNTNLTV